MAPLNKNEKRELKERLRKSYDYLRKHSPDLSYSDVALLLEINPMTFRAAFAPSSSYMSTELVEQYADFFADTFSKEWLLHGTGEMLVPEPKHPRSEHARRWQRIRYIMQREKLDYRELADKIGMDTSTAYRIIQGQSRPQNNTLEQLRKVYPKYRWEWLLIGREPIETTVTRGDEYGDTQRMIEALAAKDFPGANAEPFDPESIMSVPVVDDPAAAGTLTGYGDPIPAEDLRIINVPVDRIHSGEYRIFTVRGISMDDGSLMSLADGDQVLARYIRPDYWWNGLHTRTWLYFIFITREQGIIVKSVADQDREQRTFTLRSLNPAFPDIVVHEAEVLAIYNVIKVVDRELKR